MRSPHDVRRAQRGSAPGESRRADDDVSEGVAPPWTGTWSRLHRRAAHHVQRSNLRQIVHTSMLDRPRRYKSERIRSQPLQVSNVHIAQRSAGSSITAGSGPRGHVRWAGAVTIPVGSVAVER